MVLFKLAKWIVSLADAAAAAASVKRMSGERVREREKERATNELLTRCRKLPLFSCPSFFPRSNLRTELYACQCARKFGGGGGGSRENGEK